MTAHRLGGRVVRCHFLQRLECPTAHDDRIDHLVEIRHDLLDILRIEARLEEVEGSVQTCDVAVQAHAATENDFSFVWGHREDHNFRFTFLSGDF